MSSGGSKVYVVLDLHSSELGNDESLQYFCPHKSDLASSMLAEFLVSHLRFSLEPGSAVSIEFEEANEHISSFSLKMKILSGKDVIARLEFSTEILILGEDKLNDWLKRFKAYMKLLLDVAQHPPIVQEEADLEIHYGVIPVELDGDSDSPSFTLSSCCSTFIEVGNRLLEQACRFFKTLNGEISAKLKNGDELRDGCYNFTVTFRNAINGNQDGKISFSCTHYAFGEYGPERWVQLLDAYLRVCWNNQLPR